MQCNVCNPSIAIGGLGGSGTRAVAELFSNLGYFMGSDLNRSQDTLLFTLLFKRKDIFVTTKEEFSYRLKLFYKLMASDENILESEKKYLYALAENFHAQHDKTWLKERCDNILSVKRSKQSKWGWKEPNTHLIVDKILEETPSLKFIYVYRNGLDMAYSSNQNQLKLFGDIFLNEESIEITPKNSLKYWCKADQRMRKLYNTYPDNIYLLPFDELCENTTEELSKLFLFLGISDNIKNYMQYETVFQIPKSKDRYKKHSLDDFDKVDIECVEKIFKRVFI